MWGVAFTACIVFFFFTISLSPQFHLYIYITDSEAYIVSWPRCQDILLDSVVSLFPPCREQKQTHDKAKCFARRNLGWRSPSINTHAHTHTHTLKHTIHAYTYIHTLTHAQAQTHNTHLCVDHLGLSHNAGQVSHRSLVCFSARVAQHTEAPHQLLQACTYHTQVNNNICVCSTTIAHWPCNAKALPSLHVHTKTYSHSHAHSHAHPHAHVTPTHKNTHAHPHAHVTPTHTNTHAHAHAHAHAHVLTALLLSLLSTLCAYWACLSSTPHHSNSKLLLQSPIADSNLLKPYLTLLFFSKPDCFFRLFLLLITYHRRFPSVYLGVGTYFSQASAQMPLRHIWQCNLT
jgi:hypothetical protein